ncbi:hypothetical protein LCGC14_2793340, partial [marine sediment metagenome]
MTSEVGRFALGTAGLIAGSLVSGGLASVAIGGFIGFGLGLLFFPPDGKTIVGRRLDDLSVSFSTYGNPIVLLDGTTELGGNFVWSTGLVEHRIEEELDAKMAPSITNVSFLYTSSWRTNYCEGVAEAILKNWADNKIVADITSASAIGMFGFQLTQTGAHAVQPDIGTTAIIRNFFGGETQLPGPAEQADKGVANVSAYRGEVGQECENIPLENFGNRIPNWSALVAMSATNSKPFRRIAPPNDILTSGAF